MRPSHDPVCAAVVGGQPPLLGYKFLQRLDNQIRLLDARILDVEDVGIGYPNDCEDNVLLYFVSESREATTHQTCPLAWRLEIQKYRLRIPTPSPSKLSGNHYIPVGHSQRPSPISLSQRVRIDRALACPSFRKGDRHRKQLGYRSTQTDIVDVSS